MILKEKPGIDSVQTCNLSGAAFFLPDEAPQQTAEVT
jgi:hypothetical protein